MKKNKKYIYYIIPILLLNNINAIDLDKFFEEDTEDITSKIISDIKYQNSLKDKKILKAKNNQKIILKENRPPKVYFKQPRIYTIYTREELRSFRNIDMILNSGWKTIIVGKHQLIINDEYKVK